MRRSGGGQEGRGRGGGVCNTFEGPAEGSLHKRWWLTQSTTGVHVLWMTHLLVRVALGMRVCGEVRACVCVCQGNQFNHAQTARFNNPTLLPLLQTMSSVSCPAEGLPRRAGSRHMYRCQMPLTHHGSCPENRPRDNKIHIACSCALPLPTSLSHASLRRRMCVCVGGWVGWWVGGWVCVRACACVCSITYYLRVLASFNVVAAPATGGLGVSRLEPACGLPYPVPGPLLSLVSCCPYLKGLNCWFNPL